MQHGSGGVENQHHQSNLQHPNNINNNNSNNTSRCSKDMIESKHHHHHLHVQTQSIEKSHSEEELERNLSDFFGVSSPERCRSLYNTPTRHHHSSHQQHSHSYSEHRKSKSCRKATEQDKEKDISPLALAKQKLWGSFYKHQKQLLQEGSDMDNSQQVQQTMASRRAESSSSLFSSLASTTSGSWGGTPLTTPNMQPHSQQQQSQHADQQQQQDQGAEQSFDDADFLPDEIRESLLSPKSQTTSPYKDECNSASASPPLSLSIINNNNTDEQHANQGTPAPRTPPSAVQPTQICTTATPLVSNVHPSTEHPSHQDGSTALEACLLTKATEMPLVSAEEEEEEEEGSGGGGSSIGNDTFYSCGAEESMQQEDKAVSLVAEQDVGEEGDLGGVANSDNAHTSQSGGDLHDSENQRVDREMEGNAQPLCSARAPPQARRDEDQDDDVNQHKQEEEKKEEMTIDAASSSSLSPDHPSNSAFATASSNSSPKKSAPAALSSQDIQKQLGLSRNYTPPTTPDEESVAATTAVASTVDNDRAITASDTSTISKPAVAAGAGAAAAVGVPVPAPAPTAEQPAPVMYTEAQLQQQINQALASAMSKTEENLVRMTLQRDQLEQSLQSTQEEQTLAMQSLTKTHETEMIQLKETHQAELLKLASASASKTLESETDSEMAAQLAQVQAQITTMEQTHHQTVQTIRTSHNAEIDELIAQLDLVEEEHLIALSTEQSKVAEKETVICALSAQLVQANALVASLQEERQTHKNQVSVLQEELEGVCQEREALKVQVMAVQDDLKKNQETEASRIQVAVRTAEEELRVVAERQFSQANQLYVALKEECESCKEELRVERKKVEEEEKRRGRREANLLAEVARLKADLAASEAKVASAAQHYATELDSIRSSEQTLRTALEESKANCSTAHLSLAHMARENEELKNVCEELMAMVEGGNNNSSSSNQSGARSPAVSSMSMGDGMAGDGNEVAENEDLIS